MDKKVGLSLQRKRLDKIKRNPKNVSFQDLRSLLLGLGFKERNSGSSHYTYSRDDIAEIITVPYKRPFVSEYYVKTVLEMIDDLLDD